MPITRRELLAAGLGTVTLVVSACGDDDVDADEGVCPGGPDVEISSNHKHELNVTVEQIEAGTTRTYQFTGSLADHSHEVTITDSHFEKLVEDGMVKVVSNTMSGHTHDVLLTC